MIILDLNCANGHRFEGWFASVDAFADQQNEGHVSCPVCESTRVVRIPSAIHLS
jgi:hypothetical protein